MTNGANARKRTQRADEFDEGQRVWLLEQDMDRLVERIDVRLDRIDRRQWWVVVTFVGMIVMFSATLIALLGQR